MPLDIRITKTTSKKARVEDSELGFGKYFSDHVFAMDWDAQRGWHDARIEPYGAFSLDPAAAVLHYGQEMFEGLKAFRQQDGSVSLFRVDRHAARLAKGAERLCMPSLPTEHFVEAMKAFVTVESSWVPSSPNTSLDRKSVV